MAIAETFRFLLFYLVGLYLENKDLACELSCAGTYRHSNVHIQQHIQQHHRSPGQSLTFPYSAAKNKIRWSAHSNPPGTAVFVSRHLEPNLNICGQGAHWKQLKTSCFFASVCFSSGT